MPTPIDFYFDFSSPYGYIASKRIDALAAKYGREVTWKPILLGMVFKLTGSVPLVNIPLKGSYSRRDIARTAAFHNTPFNFPANFPIPTKAAARAFYGLAIHDPAQARALAQAVYHAYFVEGREVVKADQVAEVAAGIGIDLETFTAAINDPEADRRMLETTNEAISREVFGSPFFIVDGEPFWGNDRLDQLERWLETGGW